MGITWCRERLEQAQNAKNPVDRILIRCSNAMKPKTYFRSQDRLADDIVYRGVRKDVLQTAPPRSRPRLPGVSEWQTCELRVPEDVAPVPPPRKKRKKKLNGEVAAAGSQELLGQDAREPCEGGDNAARSDTLAEATPKAMCNGEDLPLSSEQRRQNRFIKLSENRVGKTRTDSHPGAGETTAEERQQQNGKKREPQRIKVVKNVSTVSLPNYNELIKPTGKAGGDGASGDDKSGNPSGGGKPPPRRNQSTVSLPGEGSKPILSSLSEATIHRLETYMKRCRSFGSLKPQQLLEKLEEFNKNNRSESESSDSWSGLDDWDLGVIEYCDPETANVPPLTPKSRLPAKNKKIFSVGTPQETPLQTPHQTPHQTPRPQSPVSEEGEDVEEVRELQEMVQVPESRSLGDPAYESIVTPDSVPSDWFTENQKLDKLDVGKPRTKTPPPSPANGPAEPETIIANESQSSLLEMLTKYKDEEMDSARRGSSSEGSSSRDAEPEEQPAEKAPQQKKLVRHRSRSLIETNPQLLHLQRFAKRSPSIGLERTTRLLDELERNSEAIEKEFLANPEQVLNGLRRASMCENLPEDPSDVYISRKKSSLRDSLNEFLGFEHERERAARQEDANSDAGKSEPEEKPPPPLPLNPPPIIRTSPPQGPGLLCPVVTVTSEDDPVKSQ